MVSTAKIARTAAGWWVDVQWGGTLEVHGPYRWKLVARVVAWLNDGVH